MLKQPAATAVLQRSRITTFATSAPGHSAPASPLPSPPTPSSPPPPYTSSTPPRMSSSESSVRVPSAQPPAGPNGGIPRDLHQNKSGGPPPAFFPLGYKDAAYQWWTSVAPPMVERTVLSFIPNLKEAVDSLGVTGTATAAAVISEMKDPIGTRVWRRSMVQLSGKNRALNEVCVERVGEEADETIVMVHGYGAGLGFFYKNFEPITRTPGLKLYALDMLGMGNSTRPPFKIHAQEKDDKVQEAENWFIDALEEWRKARKIERFTLVGHSLGGYMAISYAIKYPGHLKKLILASPVGIPEDPYAVNAALPEPNESTIQNEFTQDQQTITENGKAAAPEPPRRQMPSWFKWLWDANVSPFSLVRLTGPLGPRFVSGWTSRRFNHLPEEESRALHDYSFSIFKQKGSGEYALAYILAPGAYARRPAINRIDQVGRQPLTEAASGLKKETGIPIVFMYGENDWMDVEGGLAAEKKLNDAKAKALKTATAVEKKAEKGSVRIVVIPKAGHHLYLDNPDSFNDVINKEIEKTRSESK